MTVFHRTVESFKPNARTMPGEMYTSPDILAEERETIFARQWNCVGRSSAIPGAGDYFLREIAGESLIIVRGRDGVVRAFFNICRHRGTRLCQATSGQFSETIQCPYHAWTYTIDGRLIGAPHMQGAEGFDKKDYPLHEARVAELHGFLFVNLESSAPPFERTFAPMLERFARYNLAELEVGHRARYDVNANWKLVFQNYSECLHCPTIHPELSNVLPYQSGANDLTEGPFLGGYMQITPPNRSATITGRACGRYVNPALSDDEHQRAFYYSLMPNMLLSIQPDYVNYYLLTPVAVDRTMVESEWMFAKGATADAEFNPADAVEFWDVTNKQDWDIVQRSQLGISSRRYAPGPYSPRESIPAAWDREYLRMMGR
ncbi:MAG TPA: aromatic ring-hydroxylating dioxygenase subunit alpha [Gemmatimonadaceae bacterium]|nr:aromatic ring-hydroxylating dioxygenase subunit alpha [Gemmatimonadaceae bacterium]